MTDDNDTGSLPLADVATAYDIVASSTPFRSGRVIDVRTDVVKMPNGDTATRDVVRHPGAVGIVAMDAVGRVLLVRQYRHPVRHLCWEPPAGLLDEEGEDPLEAAKRELFEEAHHRADTWHVLVDAFTSPGMTEESVRIYLARDVHEAEGEKHEGLHEELDMPSQWFDLDDAVDAVLAGRLHNPMAAMGLLAAAHARSDGFASLRPAAVSWPEMSSWPGSAAQR